MAKQKLTVAKNGAIFEITDKSLTRTQLRQLINTVTKYNVADGLRYMGSVAKDGLWQITREGGESSIIETWDDPAAYEDTSAVIWGATSTQTDVTLDTMDYYFNGTYNFETGLYEVPKSAGPINTSILTVMEDAKGNKLGNIALNVNIKPAETVSISTDGLVGFPLAYTFLTDEFGKPYYWGSDLLKPAEAEAVAVIDPADDSIDAITVTDGGERYTVAPTVVIAGDGTGATAHAVLKDGYVDSVVVDTPGTGYTVAIISFTRVSA